MSAALPACASSACAKRAAGLFHHRGGRRHQRFDGGALLARSLVDGLQQRAQLLQQDGAFLQREVVALGHAAHLQRAVARCTPAAACGTSDAVCSRRVIGASSAAPRVARCCARRPAVRRAGRRRPGRARFLPVRSAASSVRHTPASWSMRSPCCSIQRASLSVRDAPVRPTPAAGARTCAACSPAWRATSPAVASSTAAGAAAARSPARPRRATGVEVGGHGLQRLRPGSSAAARPRLVRPRARQLVVDGGQQRRLRCLEGAGEGIDLRRPPPRPRARAALACPARCAAMADSTTGVMLSPAARAPLARLSFSERRRSRQPRRRRRFAVEVAWRSSSCSSSCGCALDALRHRASCSTSFGHRAGLVLQRA
jgi:hypothetical protein